MRPRTGQSCEELKKFCAKKNLEFHAISAPTGEGVKELVRAMADALDKIPKEQFEEEDAEAAEEEGDSESSAELGTKNRATELRARAEIS